ncbi:MAG TPA: hypothetical protein VKY51_06335 [Fredinandcohnia sp.]|nr:hypothetical protein [Fredinandcohnia sp.]
MSLVAQAVGESRLLPEGEAATLHDLLSRLLAHNRLHGSHLVAVRVGLPSGEPAPQVLRALGVVRIPVFWERRPTPRVEIHARLGRRRRLRSLPLEEP